MTESYLDLDPIQNVFSKAVFNVALKVSEKAKQKVSKDTGNTADEIVVEPLSPGLMEYDVISKKAHSKSLEFGSQPHWTSVKNLQPWARRVLGDEDLAYAVQRSIAKKGTKKHPFMIPAYMETKLEVAGIVKKEFDKLK